MHRPVQYRFVWPDDADFPKGQRAVTAFFRRMGAEGWTWCGHEWGAQIFVRELEQETT